MDLPQYESSQSLMIPTIKTSEIVYTVLVVGEGNMFNHLIYRYSDHDDTVPNEDRRVFIKTYLGYTVTRMVRATSYGNIFIDFVLNNGFPARTYFQPIDEIIWVVSSNSRVFSYNFENHLTFTNEKYTKEEIILKGFLNNDDSKTKVQLSKGIIVPKFRVSTKDVIISDIVVGTVDKPTLDIGSFQYKPYSDAPPEANVIPFTHVNFITKEGIEDFFRTLLVSLTGKSDLYFGDPLTSDEIAAIEKVRELRKRGIMV